MNAETGKPLSLADQLASFDARLDSKVDDVRMLADIQEGIATLLASSASSEAEIRRVLQDRYENSGLRKETFQLVKSMLDRYVSDRDPTSPGPRVTQKVPRMIKPLSIDSDKAIRDDPFGTTTIIPIAEGVKAETAETRVQVGSVLRDRFMLQERVAGGSMGVVYKALDRRLAEADAPESWVAIKILSPQLSTNVEALRALQQEAAKGRCLTHPNIVRFIDLDRDDDLYFIVMEWLEGRTLADILDSGETKAIDQERAFKIVQQVGKALDYAHRCGIVHADVKPGNVMIMPDGSAKLFDFGVARVQQKQKLGKSKFDPGVLGLMTPAYSSMQVLTGEDPVPADDVFSLACLLYRLIAGYRVFGPRNAAEAAAEGMKPQPLTGIGDKQWRTVKKALSFSRVTRYETMSQFLEALADRSEDTVGLEVAHESGIEDGSGSAKYIVALIVLVGLFGIAAHQFGFLDGLLDKFVTENGSVVTTPASTAEFVAPIPQAPATTDTVGPKFIAGELDSRVGGDTGVVAEVSAAVDQVTELIDFSTLPEPTVEIYLQDNDTNGKSATVTLREDGEPAIVDVIRADVSAPWTLRLEEVGFSGNRSPWVSGQYKLSDKGYFDFPIGQNRARVTLSMASDPLREADQQSTLRVREVDSATSEIANITVVLEDDDQRKFEAQLPSNTVAFSMSQASVKERDPAVQIDIQRFNPDDTPLVVGYVLRDVTATEGEDYFAPSSQSISFGPGQRTARLLIPLVQDSAVEGDEAFVVELSTGNSAAEINVYHRIVVMIRDDE